MKKKVDSIKKKTVMRPTVAYRFPPQLIARIKHAHKVEIYGKIVQVSENTFLIHLLDKHLPRLPMNRE